MLKIYLEKNPIIIQLLIFKLDSIKNDEGLIYDTVL
jgi:hypothetical protein